MLEHWHAEGHKALLFAQTQQMLDILEKSVQVCTSRHRRGAGSSPDHRNPHRSFASNPGIPCMVSRPY